MARLTLQIDSPDASGSLLGSWSLDGQPIGPPIAVDGSSTGPLEVISRGFLELFAQRQRPLVQPEALRALGRLLFETWFAPAWNEVQSRSPGPGPHTLAIRGTTAAVLNLPWELVELSGETPVGCDAAWRLVRVPIAPGQAIPPDVPLRPGPLRVLFLAAAPTDQQQLDYEREEDAILAITSKMPGLSLHFAEMGSLDELVNLVAECRPHVVHLSGHGELLPEGRGAFAFEDDRGRTDLVPVDRLNADVFRGNPVRCVFVNACKTSQAAAAGLCQALVGAGVPMAIGWAASVADDRAIEFAQEFYRRALRGEPIPAAVSHAREAIRHSGLNSQDEQDPTFALPQVYGFVTEGALFDPVAPPEDYRGPKTERILLGNEIEGIKFGFVGRRQELQQLSPTLLHGETTFAVVTGIGGAGKSTLATRIVNRLQDSGFKTIPVRVKDSWAASSPSRAAQTALENIIGALERAFIKANRDDLHGQLTHPKIPQAQRLHLAIDGLNELKCVLVIDNLEDALDLDTLLVADLSLAGFLDTLAKNLVRGSRVVITCRYLPEGTPTNLSTVFHLPLPDLKKHDFLKFLRRDEKVEQRYLRSELTEGFLMALYQSIGGTPGFLEHVRTILRTADPDDLLNELDNAPDGGTEADADANDETPRPLSKARAAYFEKIIATRLYDALTPEARVVASRLALSELPLPVDAIATLADLDEPSALPPLDLAVSYGFLQRFDAPDLPTLYHPPGLLRPWLSSPSLVPDPAPLHLHLARFWRSCLESNRGAELRTLVETGLRACRVHADRAGDIPLFRWATVTLARLLHHRAEWQASRALLEAIPEQHRDADVLMALARVEDDLGEWKASRTHAEAALAVLPENSSEKAATWHQLATIDLSEGRYAAARASFARALAMRQAIGDRVGEAAIWHGLASIDLSEGKYAAARASFARALAMRQAIGDRDGEAATWHNLATIDLDEGRYAAARASFARALAIKQAIGDRANEAVTFFQLGVLAHELGRSASGVPLFAIGFGISQSLGSGNATVMGQQLAGLCDALGYDQARFDAVISEAMQEYQRDRGRSLLKRAFPEWEDAEDTPD